MPSDTPSLPPKEDFIAWLAVHKDETVGLAHYLNIAGPVANWLRSLGYTEVLVTRDAIIVINQTEYVDFGAPPPDWQLILAIEEDFYRGMGGGSGEITGRGLLERLEDFGT